MSTADTELENAKVWLAKEQASNRWNYSAIETHLEHLAKLFGQTAKVKHRAMMSEFHNCAGRLPYFQDSDVGALVLEVAADGITDEELRSLFYSEALLRATWCAQAATSGGEGLARMLPVRRLEGKVANLQVRK